MRTSVSNLKHVNRISTAEANRRRPFRSLERDDKRRLHARNRSPHHPRALSPLFDRADFAGFSTDSV